jgi:hypothetical protein
MLACQLDRSLCASVRISQEFYDLGVHIICRQHTPKGVTRSGIVGLAQVIKGLVQRLLVPVTLVHVDHSVKVAPDRTLLL